MLGSVKAGIRDRTSDYIVSENSWPLFLYEDYTTNPNNLEEGLFKSKILVQVSSYRCDYMHYLYCCGARLLKQHLHLHLPQEKLMEMAKGPTYSRTTDVPDVS